jgi:hypothetical protein
MRQLTWGQAEEIASKAARKGLGFGPFTGPLPKGTTVEDVLRVATSAAVIAMREAGCLDEDNRRDQRRISQLAAKAEAEHQAWCRRTGSRC